MAAAAMLKCTSDWGEEGQRKIQTLSRKTVPSGNGPLARRPFGCCSVLENKS